MIINSKSILAWDENTVLTLYIIVLAKSYKALFIILQTIIDNFENKYIKLYIESIFLVGNVFCVPSDVW